MREDILLDNHINPCKCSDHRQNVRSNGKGNSNPSKPKPNSSWGSQIVKGFTMEKKNKLQSSIPSKKPPLPCLEIPSQKSQYMPYHSRVKRSLLGDFPCSANAVQVYPHMLDCQRTTTPASHDLFLELDHLRSLLRESKEREVALQSELIQCKENPRVSELERELDIKRIEVDNFVCRIGSLEVEKTNLYEQVALLSSILERHEENSRPEKRENETYALSAEKMTSYRSSEMEVVELRRLNKELQLQKRNLAFRLSSTEFQLSAHTKDAESDIVAKVQAEASVLRHANEDLSKQVEGLQISRLSEVEELAYLRWVNSCLRHELSNSDKLSREIVNFSDYTSIKCKKAERNADCDIDHQNLPCCPGEPFSSEICDVKKADFVKKLIKWSQRDGDPKIFECPDQLDKDWIDTREGRSPRRRHSISGPKGSLEDLVFNKRREYDGFIILKEMENEVSENANLHVHKENEIVIAQHDLGGSLSPKSFASKPEPCKVAALDVERRALRIPNPPPRATSIPVATKKNGLIPIPPPPPPPPPPKFTTRSTGVMQRAPEVAELYHSLMKRDSRKDSSSGGLGDIPNVANMRSNMIGEIENRSSHLLAIKADIETQGEFVKSLIKEVNAASYGDIEDVVAFVKWLDDELCFLVDERAVLKHFDWPEKKADTLREAAFGYRDLKKLESEVIDYEDDHRIPRDIALKKMVTLSEKMERCIYNLLRTREVMIRQCTEFQIPTDWMLDTGIISKIKVASVKLAKKYMKRVAMELQSMGATDKDPALEYMLLQGVRFAFRIHQFAGGFDAETMHAFEELRNLAHVRSKK